MDVDPIIALELHRAQRARHQENSARLAMSFATYTTTGWGEFKDSHVIDFDCTFIEEPRVSYGYSTNGDLLVSTRYPRAFGFVHQWRQDHRGYFTGAWIATVVDTQSPYIATSLPDPNYSIDHTFIFSGIAIKDLPTYLMEE